jgi:predicted dehydrogenase
MPPYSEDVAVTIGLVGTGRRATEVHAPTIASRPELRFAGVWGRTRERARALADQHGVTAFEHFDDLVRQCDAIAFAVPPAVQAELAADAIRHGKAVLLERPVAADLAGAEQLVLAAERANVVTQVALMWRYAPQVRHFLRSTAPAVHPVGGAGRLISGVLAPGSGIPAWRAERGVLRDQGADLLDLLDAALGPIVGVRGHGDSQGWVGLLLEHHVGRASEASLYALGPPGTREARVEVYGPEGHADIDCADVVGPLTYERMYDEFAGSAAAGAPHELDIHRGMHLQQVLEAADTDVTVGV